VSPTHLGRARARARHGYSLSSARVSYYYSARIYFFTFAPLFIIRCSAVPWTVPSPRREILSI